MTKRILAITLCLAMLCGSLFGCAKKDDKDLGAYITMYLTEDIFDFDPANSYRNSETIHVLGMLYETLFTLDENGKVKKGLVDSYKIFENPEINEYYIEITLKETSWNVKDKVSANDVVFAWKRLVDFRNDYDAASLLYDIKNARAIKEGDVSIDDLGVEAVEDQVVRITFEAPVDYDQFFLNLTSVATAPLCERYVSANEDWAKKASTIATSGPFKLGKINYVETGETAYDDNGTNKKGEAVISKTNKVKKVGYFVLERNSYYYRDTERDAIDKSVTPYRILVNCDITPEELLQNYKDGKVFYIDNIPLSLRTGADAEWIKKEAEVSNALSTFVLQLNQNALIDDGSNGSYLFANEKVRQALSIALDRTAIANAVVFAEVATGLVPTGIFDKGTSGDFRTSKLASNLIVANAQKDAAVTMLGEAGITPSKYSFSIQVAAYDEIHMTIAEMVKTTWCDLGFNVTLEPLNAIENNDYFSQTDSVPPDVCDDLYLEAIADNDFEVLAVDSCAFTADAYAFLSNYAYAFSGSMFSIPEKDVYEYNTHMTGYNSVSYNILIEAIYYIPFYASLEAITTGIPETETYLVTHINTKPYVESANTTFRKLDEAVFAATEAYGKLVELTTPVYSEEANELGEYDLIRVDGEVFQAALNDLNTALINLDIAAQLAEKNILAAHADETLTAAAQAAAAELSKKSVSLLPTVKQALSDLEPLTAAEEALDKAVGKKQIEAATQAYIAAYDVAFAKLQPAATKINDEMSPLVTSAIDTMTAAAASASQQTLKDAIKEVYDANGIVPTTKDSKWAEQRSILLHKAEEMLMADMPVIPVIFNQNAVLVANRLKKVSGTYYMPGFFRKLKLKNYREFYYTDPESEKLETIFKSFPDIAWDKISG